MKRLKVIALFLILMLVGMPIYAIASDVTGSLYSGTIVISNNSTANTNVATTANISTDNLISDDFLNATANNTVVRNSSGADVPFMPGYTDANLWSMWVPSIGANSYLTYILYTANSTGGELRYFPGAAGMLTVDNNTLLEPGANFSIIQAGFVSTTSGAQKFLVDKEMAIRVGISGSVDGEIEVSIPDDNCLDYVRANSDWTRVPDDAAFSFTDGVGNDAPFSLVTWINYDDASSGYIIAKRNPGGNQSEWSFFTDGADTLRVLVMNPDGTIGQEAVTLAITGNEGSWHHFSCTYDGSELNTGLEIYIDGANAVNARNTYGVYVGMTDGTENVNIGSNIAGTSGYQEGQMAEIKVYAAELTPAEILADFNGDHKTADLVAYWKIDEGAGLPQDSSGNGHHANQNLADWVNSFTQRLSAFLTATGISSGEHVVEINADSANMSLIIDAVIEDEQPLAGFSVPNVADNWTLVRAAAMPYMEYHEISIGGNLRQRIEWLYSANFTDLSGNGQTAYPSFRTASSDPNVAASLTSFTPISEAQAPPYALGPVNPFIEGTGNVTGNFTTTVVPPPGGFPLAGVIAAVAGATATPPQLPLLIIACFVILAASLTTTYLLRKYGSGSLLVKAFVIIGVMGIFIALGDFGIDFWMLIVFGIFAAALSLMSKQGTWGG